MKKQSILFIAHGSPMNAIANNNYTNTLKKFAQKIGKPKGIVMISAHWITTGKTFIQSSQQLETLHDFFGFPQSLFDVSYRPKGSPDLARKVFNLLNGNVSSPVEIVNYDALDHGAWSILTHMYPESDVPIVEVSMNFSLTANEHFNIGKQIASLSEDGYLIIGSGNLIHNLRDVDFHNLTDKISKDWPVELAKVLREAIKDLDFNKLINYEKLPMSQFGINAADHYMPFLYSLGASSAEKLKPYFIYDAFELGTLDMLSIEWK